MSIRFYLKSSHEFILPFSFDTDTGLKQALATVNDYNPLMKDFPINELLSATELERIRSAVQVFSALPTNVQTDRQIIFFF